MKNWAILVLAVVLLILLLLYTSTFQVRFDQVAVVTTMGRATDEDILNDDPEQDDSGLHFKWFYPFQSVKTYDKRVQVLEDRPEELQTRDNISVVIQPYLAWRVSDPLKFYKTLTTMDRAEDQLRIKLREAKRVVGRYTFSDLANTDADKLRLHDVENEILQQMRGELVSLEQTGRPFGIELVSVGIKRVLLAPQTTAQVFERMRSTRLRMAEEYRQEGEARAKEIQTKAESVKDTILTFARARAEHIRSEGEVAAFEYFKVFSQDQEFAVALQKLEALQAIFSDAAKGKSTFIFDTSNPLWEWFSRPPGSAGSVSNPTTAHANPDLKPGDPQ